MKEKKALINPSVFLTVLYREKRAAFKVYGHPAPRGGGVKWIRASDTLITL